MPLPITWLKESVGKNGSLRATSVISVSPCLRVEIAKKKLHHGGTENTEELFSDRLLKPGVNESCPYHLKILTLHFRLEFANDKSQILPFLPLAVPTLN